PPPDAPFLPVNCSPAADTYPLSLHDALPIYEVKVLKTDENGKPIETPSATAVALSQAITEIAQLFRSAVNEFVNSERVNQHQYEDRKSTRLHSSHVSISYAVFCLKKRKHDRV